MLRGMIHWIKDSIHYLKNDFFEDLLGVMALGGVLMMYSWWFWVGAFILVMWLIYGNSY